MSLRWKLFRFLSVETVLPPSAGHDAPDAFGETALFPSLAAHDHEQHSHHRVLRRFATAADRALHADAADGFYVFALPRGVAQFFHLARLDPALALTPAPPPARAPVPLHYTFSAHDGSVLALALVRHPDPALPTLVTLGADDGTPCLKVWTFQNDDLAAPPSPRLGDSPVSENPGDENRFQCVATYRLPAEAEPTTLAVKNAKAGLSVVEEVAVGFADGSVTILSGDVARERVTRARVAPAPGEMIEAKPIVFTRYCGDVLYAVSEMSVVAIVPVLTEDVTDARGPMFRRDILDNLGASSRNLCCTIDESAELVVAKEEALYFFNREGRGPCLAFPTKGQRASVSSVGNYLVHATGPGSITAYDIVNKLIAYRGKGNVSCSFQGHVEDAKNVLLCITEGSILRLSEISLEERVNMLLKRGLYVPAVGLARTESARLGNENMEILTRALRQYAEYLMSKDRYDEAAEQLVETIGEDVEPSWVIARLVEQSGLRSGLRLYLEALHAAGKAAFVHTKVLITCYRHDRARGTILGSKAAEKTNDEYVINVFSDVDWSEDQVDAAIKMCRDAGLFKVAERVSRRRGRYVQLARTLVEDLNEMDKALALLRSLQDLEALRVIQACGRQLLVKDPVNFVHYLADAICRSSSMLPVGRTEPVLKLSSFLPIFIDMPRWRAVLLERILGTPGGISSAEAPRAWILLFESLVCVDVAERLRAVKVSLNSKPMPEEEAKSELDGLNGNAKPDDVKSLSASESSFDLRERRVTGRRALKILQSRRSAIDLRAALEIAEQYGHGPCLEYLYEHLRMYNELGICLRMSENGASLVRACRRHGDREPRLWMECIRLYAPLAAKEEFGAVGNSDPALEIAPASPPPRAVLSLGLDALAEDGSVRGVLSNVSETGSEKGSALDMVDEAMVALDRCGVLSALEIVELVADACPGGAWGLVREFFERVTTGLRRDAAGAEHAGLLLSAEARELQREAGRLGSETVVVKPRTCAACEDALTVPAVHFFCEHSYHAGCLAPGASADAYGGAAALGDAKAAMWAEECPRCAPELDAMVSMRQALQDKNERHDEFFGTLRNARDGFATVVEFLERNPFI